MLDSGQCAGKANQTLTLQIIVGSLAGGLIFFMIAVVGVHQVGAMDMPLEGELQVLTYLGLGGVGVSLVVPGIVSNVIVSSGRRQIAADLASRDRERTATRTSASGDFVTERLRALLQTKTIVESAMTEAGGMLAVAVFMVNGNRLCALGAVFLAAILLLRMPTKARLAEWLDAQKLALDETRILHF